MSIQDAVEKGYLEAFKDLTVLGNTEDIFSAQRDDVHLPAQGASVGYRIAFGHRCAESKHRIARSLRKMTLRQLQMRVSKPADTPFTLRRSTVSPLHAE
jgi:hypothetical protein